MGDAQRAALVAIAQVKAEVLPVREQLYDIADTASAKDDHHLGDAHARECLQGEIDHRPVEDRQEMFVGDQRQWMQAGAVAACEDYAFHRHLP